METITPFPASAGSLAIKDGQLSAPADSAARLSKTYCSLRFDVNDYRKRNKCFSRSLPLSRKICARRSGKKGSALSDESCWLRWCGGDGATGARACRLQACVRSGGGCEGRVLLRQDRRGGLASGASRLWNGFKPRGRKNRSRAPCHTGRRRRSIDSRQ